MFEKETLNVEKILRRFGLLSLSDRQAKSVSDRFAKPFPIDFRYAVVAENQDFRVRKKGSAPK